MQSAAAPSSGAIRWIKQLTAGDVFGCRAGSVNCGEKAGPDFDVAAEAVDYLKRLTRAVGIHRRDVYSAVVLNVDLDVVFLL